MRIIILLIILLILLSLLFYTNKEKFSGLNILFYPDPDIENQEKWVKEHVNDTINKKKMVYTFLSILGKQLNNIFYSSQFTNIMQSHNNKIFEEKVPYIISVLKDKFTEISENNDGKREYELFSSATNKNILQILIDYLRCNHNALVNTPSTTDCNIYLEDNITKMHFDNSKFKQYNLANDLHLIHKYFTNRDMSSLINIFKKKLIKYYINQHEEYKSQDYVPCMIYDKESCPSGGYNSKCEIVSDKCLPKSNRNRNINNNPINDCNSISLYGSDLCNRTTNKDLQNCSWNENMQKCLNPNESSNPIKCENLRSPNLEDKCANLKDSSGNGMCDYLSKTMTDEKGNQVKHEFCYDKEQRNKMTCLNLSGIYDKDNTEDAKVLQKYKCSTTNMGDTQYHYDESLTSKERINNIDCGIFDNSSYIRDKNNTYFFKKDDDRKYLVEDIVHQQKLCENNKDGNNPNSASRCNFVKHHNFNNKTQTKCLSKNTFVSSNFIDDEDNCKMMGFDYIGNSEQKKCLDISAKCNDIKYKSLCDLRDNKCMWINGLSELSDNSKDLVERGYCVNQDLSELDNLIDDYHNEEISKIAKFRNLSNELNKLNTNEEILKKLKNKMN
jgi:hypothetical protein